MRRFYTRFLPLLRCVFPWPLVPIAEPWRAGLASGATLLALLLSRLLLLPAGPWEQDEALMGCGVLDFDPGRHMPLPPGFPLWVGIGSLVRACGVADPVLALQLASAVFSVVGLWALVGLWDGVAGRGLALAGALLAACVPGVWFHAARAFSETPSAALAIVGLALWLRGGRAGFVPGVVAMTCAALVRPPLAPVFVLAVALAAWGVRREPRRLMWGVVAAIAALACVMVPAALAAGGWSYLWGASVAHAGDHFATLGTEPWGIVEWGYVRGLVNPLVAALFAAFAAVGWISWWKRLRGRWMAAGLLGVFLLFLVIAVDNRTYPRYWVLVWLLLATPAVGGLAALVRSRLAAGSAAAVAALVFAWWAGPAMTYLHRNPLPAVSLLHEVASEGKGVLVFEDQLFSFRNLAVLSGWLRVDSLRLSEMRRTHLGFGGTPFWMLAEGAGEDIACPASRVVEARCLEPKVRLLSQDRFLALRLVRNPVLVWEGGFPPEWEGLHRFVWCRAKTSLLLPAVDDAGMLGLAVEPHPQLGNVEVRLRVNGVEAGARILPPGRQVMMIPIPPPADANAATHVELTAARELVASGDGRPLALRVFAASLQAPPHLALPLMFFPEQESMFAAFAQAEGTYPPELIGVPPRPAAWTGPRAVFSFPVGAGMVGVELCAPRPQPALVEVRLGPAWVRLLVAAELTHTELRVPAEMVQRGRATLEIHSSTFVPGAGDSRALGVAVSRVWYLPSVPDLVGLR
ncbi:MAG: hypothetical protein ACHQQS_01000 [Thermoanaerobaculales bacterium]